MIHTTASGFWPLDVILRIYSRLPRVDVAHLSIPSVCIPRCKSAGSSFRHTKSSVSNVQSHGTSSSSIEQSSIYGSVRPDTESGDCQQRSNMQKTTSCLSAKPITLAISHLECKLSYSCNNDSPRFSDDHVKKVKIVFLDMRSGRKQTPSQCKAVIVLPDTFARQHDHDLLSFTSDHQRIHVVTRLR